MEVFEDIKDYVFFVMGRASTLLTNLEHEERVRTLDRLQEIFDVFMVKERHVGRGDVETAKDAETTRQNGNGQHVTKPPSLGETKQKDEPPKPVPTKRKSQAMEAAPPRDEKPGKKRCFVHDEDDTDEEESSREVHETTTPSRNPSREVDKTAFPSWLA